MRAQALEELKNDAFASWTNHEETADRIAAKYHDLKKMYPNAAFKLGSMSPSELQGKVNLNFEMITPTLSAPRNNLKRLGRRLPGLLATCKTLVLFSGAKEQGD